MKKRILSLLLVLTLAAALFCAPAAAAQMSDASAMTQSAYQYLVNYVRSGELNGDTYMVFMESSGSLGASSGLLAAGDGLGITVLVCYEPAAGRLYVQATEEFDEIAEMTIPKSGQVPFTETLERDGRVVGTTSVKADYSPSNDLRFTSTSLTGESRSQAEMYNSALINGMLNVLGELLEQGGMSLRDLGLTVVAPFTDVRLSDYFYSAVRWAVEKDVTNGTSATTFSPNATCTRAQVVTFLWRAAGSPAPATSVNPFTDVNVNDWYGKAVLWAVAKNITNGVDATHFGTDQGCTRAQVVTFLHRALNGSASGSWNPFYDVSYGAYYYNAVLWAVNNSITNGVDDNHFGPDVTCTRGQIVTFLYRAQFLGTVGA